MKHSHCPLVLTRMNRTKLLSSSNEGRYSCNGTGLKWYFGRFLTAASRVHSRGPLSPWHQLDPCWGVPLASCGWCPYWRRGVTACPWSPHQLRQPGG
jgi:hypothetical protein